VAPDSSRGVPLLIVVPIFLGWLKVQGQEAGLYRSSLGTASLVLVLIGFLAALMGWVLHAVRVRERALDAARNDAEATARTLVEREQRIAGLLGSISDTFMSFDSQWRFTFINDNGLKRMSKTREELIGRKLWERFPEAVGNEAYVQLHRAMQERVPVEYEVFYSPWQRWFFDRAYPTPDGGLAVYSLDITERKRSEQSLREALSDLQMMHRLTSDLARPGEPQDLYERLMDCAVEIMHANFASLQKMHPERGDGEGAMELLAQRGFTPQAAESWKRVLSDSNSSCGVALKSGRRCDVPNSLDDARISGDELATYTQNGILALQTTPLISRDGHLLGAISTHWSAPRDPSTVTEREWRLLDVLAQHAADLLERLEIEQSVRDNEQRIRQIIQQLPAGVGVMDAAGSWVLTNPLMDRYVPDGLPSTLPVRGPQWRACDAQGRPVSPDNWPGKRALRGEIVVPGIELLYRNDGGQETWVRVSAAPLRDHDGRIVGATSVVENLDAIRVAQEALQESQERFRLMVESAQDYAIFSVGPAGQITGWNTGAKNLLGYEEAELVGKDAGLVYTPEDRASNVPQRELEIA
jgi:PAS domain-containing protein